MCQLLGISANKPVDMRFSLREWKHRGRTNPDGYGFAHWIDSRPVVVKSPSSLFETKPMDIERVAHVRSSLFLCHVRFASVGTKDGNNAHPFMADLNGKTYVFAHNGTLKNIRDRRLEFIRPDGTTDSEHAFCWILERLARKDCHLLAKHLKDLSDDLRKLGRFNFLMSDGDTLYAYADNSLHWIERKPPYGGELVGLNDDGYRISLAEVKAPDEHAVLVATSPLTDEAGWTQIPAGELMIIRDGAVTGRVNS